ncbi:MAG: hypothetical protein QXG35_09005 [Nitrososphaerota archaeon]
MSVLEQVRRVGGVEEAPKPIEELINRLLERGVRANDIAVVRPRPRSGDPILYVRGEAVAAWLKVE